MLRSLLFLLLVVGAHRSVADDGYRLWLKYDLIQDAAQRKAYQQATQFIAIEGASSPVLQSAVKELQLGLKGLLGQPVSVLTGPAKKQGGIILRVNSAANVTANDRLKKLSKEGYSLRSEKGNVVVAGPTDAAVLYGTFALLRQLQTRQSLANLALTSTPKIEYRMLNHWDNPNGTVERGYAGSSIWKWYELPELLDPRYQDYARANASIGINGVVINNVNASARYLTPEYLRKVAALAKVFRAYGIRVYLSVFWAAPKTLGGLPTSDPLDPKVRSWWTDKTNEIYKTIPDFGGFLVKANSEGEPGPQDYGRNHAEGANMLTEALGQHDGIVMWRAFVYKANSNGDRFKEAYEEFKPLDGKFAAKALVQVKNGPIDFMAREPFHPLFGAMPSTPLVLEVQLTQEYLGFATHMVYLGPLIKECLETDTYSKGKGSTVAKVVDGSVDNHQISGIAGVANIGSDRNWTGHPMGQANWYAYGRLAWDHTLSSEALAKEWTRMTLTSEPKAVSTITNLLVKSRDIYVRYTMPLGLHHIMGQTVHYGPEPWLSKSARPDWTAVYYHKADSIGLGFDRTAKGSNALSLYKPEVQQMWGDAKTCPLNYLLWFHHVPWKQPLSTGRTLWNELCYRYYTGADSVVWMQQQWTQVKPAVDPALYADVAARLQAQHKEAIWWRDACVLYFQTFAKQPIPAPFAPPERSLEAVKQIVDIYQMR
ncbi:alpha-glucuronidase family glycosyl hydrolase [Hymenobacter sp. GOD-10R]|uniref:alpha-glucuronidase family glycosyl hydrolase n=1 Tax=Hymenobacter sp. GOD-10R TaxID=3093922 RepID=UPI002D7945BE|nr:alpha-glucuronidase family glycosyl hydrolase [Hymenobacter sp. GOD-10R]WRQ26278.1 alpha-glucuronidase family glycosyl hydrolase [Hymenobacter sp. GOD-10R]